MRIVFIYASGYNLFVICPWTISKSYDDLQTDNMISFTPLHRKFDVLGEGVELVSNGGLNWADLFVQWVDS